MRYSQLKRYADRDGVPMVSFALYLTYERRVNAQALLEHLCRLADELVSDRGSAKAEVYGFKSGEETGWITLFDMAVSWEQDDRTAAKWVRAFDRASVALGLYKLVGARERAGAVNA